MTYELPTLQSLMYTAVLLSTATSVPLVGYLRDAFGQTYSLPFLVTFGASLVEVGIMSYLMGKDHAAAAGKAQHQQGRTQKDLL